MERESFKEYPEAATLEKEQLRGFMLRRASYVFINKGGDISSEPNTEQSVKEFSSNRGTLR